MLPAGWAAAVASGWISFFLGDGEDRGTGEVKWRITAGKVDPFGLAPAHFRRAPGERAPVGQSRRNTAWPCPPGAKIPFEAAGKLCYIESNYRGVRPCQGG